MKFSKDCAWRTVRSLDYDMTDSGSSGWPYYSKNDLLHPNTSFNGLFVGASFTSFTSFDFLIIVSNFRDSSPIFTFFGLVVEKVRLGIGLMLARATVTKLGDSVVKNFLCYIWYCFYSSKKVAFDFDGGVVFISFYNFCVFNFSRSRSRSLSLSLSLSLSFSLSFNLSFSFSLNSSCCRCLSRSFSFSLYCYLILCFSFSLWFLSSAYSLAIMSLKSTSSYYFFLSTYT